MDPGSAGQKAGPHHARGTRYHQHRLWRQRLENVVLHQPDPSGRGEREDSWPARADPNPEKIALVCDLPGTLVSSLIPIWAVQQESAGTIGKSGRPGNASSR